MSEQRTHAAHAFEIGIYSFVEWTPDPVTGARVSPVERMHNLLETIEQLVL